MFGNLLDDAVFHNDEAKVRIDVDVTADAETAVVRIADNGPGIPDSRKREVFGRGEKGLESPGSGLGLYLVDNLAETYGGRCGSRTTKQKAPSSMSNYGGPAPSSETQGTLRSLD